MSAGTATGIMLRPLLREDLQAAQALTASFGWPYRVEDWVLMHDLAHGLGHGVAAECDGELVGTALGWRYGRDWAALGMVGVARRMQGQGLGRRLMERVLAALDGRSVVLHATEAGLHLYGTLGFVPAGRVRQHQGAAYQTGLAALREGERLRPTGRSDPAVLAALDLEAGGMERPALVAALLESGLGVVLDRGGRAAGFAVLRRFGIGQVIGPVVAPDAAAARALIGHFLASNPGQFIRIDVPEESGLSPWLQALGLPDAGPAIRMVRGAALPPREARAGAGAGAVRRFALASQAFG